MFRYEYLCKGAEPEQHHNLEVSLNLYKSRTPNQQNMLTGGCIVTPK